MTLLECFVTSTVTRLPFPWFHLEKSTSSLWSQTGKLWKFIYAEPKLYSTRIDRLIKCTSKNGYNLQPSGFTLTTLLMHLRHLELQEMELSRSWSNVKRIGLKTNNYNIYSILQQNQLGLYLHANQLKCLINFLQLLIIRIQLSML